jgi:nucleoside-diphosphate-sugar epimerase
MADAASRNRLFCFGLGYSAGRLAKTLLADGWRAAGTTRTAAGQAQLAAEGIDAFRFDGDRPMADAARVLAGATHILSSVPPGPGGDPVLAHHGHDIRAVKTVRWIGYLSTTGVYGDTLGATVTETSDLNPTSERSRQRVEAEEAWLKLARDHGLPAHVFRLAGIYGPGRSALDQVRNGQARRIDKPDHLFSRIHVDDIGLVLRASMERPAPGAVYNVCDDQPAAAADVTLFACELLGVPPPDPIPFEEARLAMSPMALSFWRDNRRVSNRRIHEELGVRLNYPDYRAGLRAVLAAGG